MDKRDLRDNYPDGAHSPRQDPRSSASTPLPAPPASPSSLAIPGATSRCGPSASPAALAAPGITRQDTVQVSYGYVCLPRPWAPLRRGEDRRYRRAHLRRQHQAPAHAHAGPWLRRRGLHPLLRADDGRDHPRPEDGPVQLQAARRPLRRRALDGGHAQRDRKAPSHQGP